MTKTITNFATYIFVVLIYWFILLPTAGEDTISPVTAIHDVIWRSSVLNFVIFHVLLGLILYYILSIAPLIRVILVTLMPAFSFICAFLVSYFTNNLGREPEGIYSALLFISIAICASLGGALFAFFMGKLHQTRGID